MNFEQKDLFSSVANGALPITLELSNIEVEWRENGQQRILRGIPSFKTGKTAIAWRDKVSGRMMARPLTLPHHAKWMKLAIHSIESQLRCALGITDEKIRMVASARSWIASRVPLDDSWAWVPEIQVTSRLCREGESEGATVTIQRLR